LSIKVELLLQVVLVEVDIGGCLERSINNRIEVQDQISKSSNKEVHIGHLASRISIDDVLVQGVEVQDVTYQVLEKGC
jgi:hypothetical protein